MDASNYPLGIRQLSSLDRVCVRQKRTILSGNEYLVVDVSGQPLLQAKEAGGLTLMGGRDRPFDISVIDTQDRQVMTLRRPYTFGPDKLEVRVCGQLASVVRQEMTFMKPVLIINDPSDRVVLRVKGPAITTGQCDFEIFAANKERVGVIRKLWGGLERELLTSSDSYQLGFPEGLDVRFKAAIIGACLLIDFRYYSV